MAWAAIIGWAGLLVLALAPRVVAGEETDSWQVVRERDGITFSKRPGKSEQFPVFRGQGTVRANIFEVFAVIYDVPRHRQWMYRCAEARLLGQEGVTRLIVYNRTALPWPVADRDVVLATALDVDEDSVTIHFRSNSAQSLAVPNRVVRMTHFEGHFKLTARAQQLTDVEYVVAADPGGRVPQWMANLYVARLPLDTLRGLRQQVQNTRGQYDTNIADFRARPEATPLRW
jgi:hypothetical protein